MANDELPAIEHRVDELEKHKERTDARLDGGAKAFEAVRKEIDKLVDRTSPKPFPWLQGIAVIFGILGTILGVWWNARGELDAKADKADVSAVQHEQTEQRVVLTSVKSTAENTAQQLGEMKADTKADLTELKSDIRALAGSRGR